MVEMAESFGAIRRPKATWGGRWSGPLEDLVASDAIGSEWVDVVDYAGTVAYQVARTLNLGAELAKLAALEDNTVRTFEFASRRDSENRSVLLVKLAEV